MPGKLEELILVKFPKSVGEEESIKILSYVSKKLGYRIHGSYSGSYFISEEDGPKRYSAELKEIRGTFLGKDFTTVPFFFLKDEKNLEGIFSGIRFDTIIGYEIHEHDERLVRGWGEIKEAIRDYFDERDFTERQHKLDLEHT